MSVSALSASRLSHVVPYQNATRPSAVEISLSGSKYSHPDAIDPGVRLVRGYRSERSGRRDDSASKKNSNLLPIIGIAVGAAGSGATIFIAVKNAEYNRGNEKGGAELKAIALENLRVNRENAEIEKQDAIVDKDNATATNEILAISRTNQALEQANQGLEQKNSDTTNSIQQRFQQQPSYSPMYAYGIPAQPMRAGNGGPQQAYPYPPVSYYSANPMQGGANGIVA
jgi:hypothetical protein